mgnify:CR=1 FL=1
MHITILGMEVTPIGHVETSDVVDLYYVVRPAASVACSTVEHAVRDAVESRIGRATAVRVVAVEHPGRDATWLVGVHYAASHSPVQSSPAHRADVDRVFRRAVEAFGDEMGALRWLVSHLEVLSGATPLECVSRGDVHHMMNLLDRIDADVYA